MQIDVEWTAGVMRLLVAEYGGPYVWSASVVRDGDALTIKGAAAMPANPHVLREAVRAWCRAAGVRRVRWERLKGGRQRKAAHAVD